MSGFHSSAEVAVDEDVGQQAVTAPRAAWELGAALADHSVPVDDRGGASMSEFLRMASDAWAAAKTDEPAGRALEKVRFLRLVERGSDVALQGAVEDAREVGASWAGVGWALNTSRQSAYQRFTA